MDFNSLMSMNTLMNLGEMQKCEFYYRLKAEFDEREMKLKKEQFINSCKFLLHAKSRDEANKIIENTLDNDIDLNIEPEDYNHILHFETKKEYEEEHLKIFVKMLRLQKKINKIDHDNCEARLFAHNKNYRVKLLGEVKAELTNIYATKLMKEKFYCIQFRSGYDKDSKGFFTEQLKDYEFQNTLLIKKINDLKIKIDNM